MADTSIDWSKIGKALQSAVERMAENLFAVHPKLSEYEDEEYQAELKAAVENMVDDIFLTRYPNKDSNQLALKLGKAIMDYFAEVNPWMGSDVLRLLKLYWIERGGMMN